MKTSKSETPVQKKATLKFENNLSAKDMLMVRGGNDDPEPPIIRVKL